MSDSDQVKDFVTTEKAKKQPMTFKQKVDYFKDYYLLKVVLVLIALVFVGLFIKDAIKNSKTIYTGGTVGFDIYQEKYPLLCDGFISYLGDDYKGKNANFGGNALMVPEGQEYDKNSIETAFIAQLNAGMYDYLFMTEKQFEYFAEVEFYQDLSYLQSDPKYSELEFGNGIDGKPAGIKLNDKVLSKLDLSGMDIYLVFVIKKDQNDMNMKFVDYLYS